MGIDWSALESIVGPDAGPPGKGLSDNARQLIEAANQRNGRGCSRNPKGAPTEDAKAARRAEGGRKAKGLGDEAEAMVVASALEYAERGIALQEKFPTPVVRLGGKANADGSFRARWGGKAGADIVGCIQGGRYVRIEVKHTLEASIPLKAVTDGQAAQLDLVADLGGVAAVLVVVRGCWWLVPWAAWVPWADTPKQKSLSPKALDAIGVRCEVRAFKGKKKWARGVDWLPALQALIGQKAETAAAK